MECIRRRVKDVDFERREITVREVKLYGPVIPPGSLDSSSEARYNRHYHDQDSMEYQAALHRHAAYSRGEPEQWQTRADWKA